MLGECKFTNLVEIEKIRGGIGRWFAIFWVAPLQVWILKNLNSKTIEILNLKYDFDHIYHSNRIISYIFWLIPVPIPIMIASSIFNGTVMYSLYKSTNIRCVLLPRATLFLQGSSKRKFLQDRPGLNSFCFSGSIIHSSILLFTEWPREAHQKGKGI